MTLSLLTIQLGKILCLRGEEKKLQISKDAAHAADVTDQNIEMDVSKKNGPLERKRAIIKKKLSTSLY